MFTREFLFVSHLETGGDLKAIIHAENENIHRPRSQLFFDEFDKFIQAIKRRSWDSEFAHGQPFIERIFHALHPQQSE